MTIAAETTFPSRSFFESEPLPKLGEYVMITVSDTGVGMPPEVVERIFEPFFTTKETGEGTGLGLASVYGIVKQHDGFITVHSEQGKGTAMKIFLPVSEKPDGLAEEEEEEPIAAGGTETILLAEDEQQVLLLNELILRKAGYRTLSATDGEEAVKLFERHKDEIDLCILDVVMPKMSGQLVFKEIQALRPGLPVIFCSGYSFSRLKQRDLIGSRHEVLAKPYTAATLLRKVRGLLDRDGPR